MHIFLKAAAALAIGGAAVGTAHAATIVPVAVTAKDLGRDFAATHLIDGSGLSSSSVSATHGTTHTDNWLSANGDTRATLSFDLGASYVLSAIDLWQYTFFTDRQIKTFNLLTSLDGTAFTTALTGASLKQDAEKTSNVAQTVTFDAVGRYVRLAITENTGNRSYTGLGEVRFQGIAAPVVPTPDPLPPVSGAVPEPATWAMMLVGFGVVGGAMRRRRARPLRIV